MISEFPAFLEAPSRAQSLFRGIVIASHDEDCFVVRFDSEDGKEKIVCEVLQASDRDFLHLTDGDRVLIATPDAARDRGIILGRIGRSRTERTPDLPEELVLEATKNLTLKCGDGSITIREDGKILLKGKDLISHAERMNRIKGGAVAIN